MKCKFLLVLFVMLFFMHFLSHQQVQSSLLSSPFSYMSSALVFHSSLSSLHNLYCFSFQSQMTHLVRHSAFNLFLYFIFSSMHRLLSPLTMDEFAWSHNQAVLYNNIFFAVSSIFGIITLHSMKHIAKRSIYLVISRLN